MESFFTEGGFKTLSTVFVVGGLMVLLAAENLRPLRVRKKTRPGRYLTNAVLTGLALLAGAVAVRPVGLGLAYLSETRAFGVLNWLTLPGWARFAAGFLIMDLTFYYWHRFNHTVHFLWRFHSVHHIDPDLDVTTSMRFHFGEVLLSTLFRAVQVAAIGIAPVTYIVYETCFTLATLFHHSNLQIPVTVERSINRVLVTPRMHGIHHSVVRSELNSNYSVIFRWWDALNQSLVLNVPQSAISAGVGRFAGEGDNSILRLVALPFGKFRREKPARPPRFGTSDLGRMAE
jgi:sterol desaturase/sphingolipid hydroxylase (fatty acid hydroxylase superfamily)